MTPAPHMLFLSAVLAATAFAASPLADDQAVAPFLQSHCLRCHGEKKQKGDFRMDTLSRDFSDLKTAEKWAEVMDRINAGEMPPEDEKQPLAAEIGGMVNWLSARLKEGEATRMAKRGPVSLYRLSREEYGNTVYDLLGVYYDVDAPGAFNEDPRWHGFDRIGSMLSLSPSHVDRYFKAAESVLERAFPEKPIVAAKGRSEAKDGTRWLLFPGLRKGSIRVTAPGLYRLRIQLSALPSFKGRLPHLALWHPVSKRSFAGRDVVAPEEKPTVIEIETFLPEGNIEVTNEAPGKLDDGFTGRVSDIPFTNTKAARNVVPHNYKLFDEEDRPIFPLLIVDSVEWEGPILSEADRKKTEGLMPAKDGDLAEARACLQRFATRAWRRPVADGELERFMKVVQGEVAAGEKFRSACLAGMTGVLTAKNFYYLEEGSATQRREKVNDWELASRLSYFLWGSMPDDELFAAAQSGRLHEPEVSRTQVARMLGDAKIKRFTDAFPQQWLQLHRVGMFPPDPELYPDYDKWLEQSMILEAAGYFTEVFTKNLSLREFLASDWTMLNSRLAMHYGLPPLKDSALQRVSLRPEEHRGGLLTQAGVLMLTSDGTRHRPVHRGVWVSEAIFGRTPPPPPPNVEPLEPTPSNKPKSTVRAQLEAHATNANCAACHAKIDPLGFAFDNYDALGRWRTEEILKSGQGANPPVNANGVMADGRKYGGPEEFKQLLVHDLDRFGEAFVEQLATFALRRAMTIDDAAQIKAVAKAGQADGYKLRTIVERFTESELFQKR
jgi:mono/diheme cytochrome c family protein